MNFHGDNMEKKGNHNHSPLKHMLHMVLCCGLPLVILAVLPLISKFSPSAGSTILKIVPFLCPLMMIGMIPMMLGGNKRGSCCDDKNNNHTNMKLPKINKPME
ncbi:MAG: hypothetical protein K0R09_54 [Clostridiales bacterium]|jgi:hypothetical protein|nr:hypothetical protein [Clostridiales bacterium]